MRAQSRSARALGLVLEVARVRGAETRLLDLHVAELPMFRPATKHAVESLREATEAVNWAEVFVLASPDYHGSMTGAMKNFLDHYWTEFGGKLFGYLCASHEKGLTAMDQMRTAVRQCYGWSMPYGVAFSPDEDFDAALNVTNPTVTKRLDMLARDLVIYGTALRDQFQSDLRSDDADTFVARYRKK